VEVAYASSEESARCPECGGPVTRVEPDLLEESLLTEAQQADARLGLLWFVECQKPACGTRRWCGWGTAGPEASTE
jgi:uncharacterized protein with PIN domain